MTILFYPLKLNKSSVLIPLWVIFGLSISNVIGIFIISFMNCAITENANIPFQILYHLLPLYLTVDALKNTNKYPTMLISIIILLFQVSYDYMLYVFDVFDVYECKGSSLTALLSLVGIDVITTILVEVFTRIRKSNIKKQKLYLLF